MTRYLFVTLVIAAVAVLAGACGESETPTPPPRGERATSTASPTPTSEPQPTEAAQAVTSDIKDFTLQDLSVDVGASVTWIQRDRTPHTTTSGQPGSQTGLWDSGALSEGGSFQHTFTEAGTFPYFCRFHPSTMRATITVVGAGSPAPSPTEPPTPQPTKAPDTTAPTEPSESDAGKYVWEVSQVDEMGAKSSLALAPDGTPHVAYILEDMPGFVKHSVLGPEGWETSTVSAGYFYGPLDIVVGDEGAPHIAWHNHDLENEAYAVLADGVWAQQDLDHPGHDGWDNSLALDSRGLPHTASVDPSQFGSRSGVEYASFDGESWTVEEVGSGPVPYEFGTEIALDADDRVPVAWYDQSEEDLKYATKEGGAWTITTVDGDGDAGRFPSMVLDQQGNPVIGYFESTGGSEGYIKLARFSNGQWSVERVDTLEDVSLGHFGARNIVSVALDGDKPVLAYSDTRIIKLAWWDGSDWNLETVLEIGDTPFGQQISMALDSSGSLHLTYVEVINPGGHGVWGPVKYARGVPAAPSQGGFSY